MTDLNKIASYAQGILNEIAKESVTEQKYVTAGDMAGVRNLLDSGETNIRLEDDGDWSNFVFKGMRPEGRASISPVNPNYIFPAMEVAQCENIAFSGFKIARTDGQRKRGKLVYTLGGANLAFRDMELFSDLSLTNDPTSYVDWTLADWTNRIVGGFHVASPDSVIEGCKSIACYMSIVLYADRCASSRNKVLGFSGDAYRLIGDNCTSDDDYAQDAFQINKNHSDVLQSWSIGEDRRSGSGVRKGLSIRRLTARRWTLGDHLNHPLMAEPQGIGMFDGIYENCLVEDCDLDIGAYHGISFYGAKDVIIRGNKVWDHFRPEAESKRPWIMVHDHKNGTQSTGSLIKDNICQNITVDDATAKVSGNVKANVAA
ncbi:hypothetical protein SAMN05444339_11050 [Loktanella atrilutea]|uniref:Right handed beta helix region n=1 Tax=Loktanella atrilutea TaxID=366533 RepID=A0A1M5DLN2_LOKAT|nr:hypothetical protein [Loktanella atrilutea]SHF67887.1 hypothetical protein SAMN05444339_11050 [Loktanella atrilutea]